MVDLQKLMTIRFARPHWRTAPGDGASDRLLQVRDGGMIPGKRQPAFFCIMRE